MQNKKNNLQRELNNANDDIAFLIEYILMLKSGEVNFTADDNEGTMFVREFIALQSRRAKHYEKP